MARKQKKYHFIYKTTCIKTNRFYIGMHSTDNLDDGYLGSGKRLWHSINYHGKENHKVEILEFCENREELKKREEEIVNLDLLREDLCMNLTTGGHSGQEGFVNEEHKIKFQNAASLYWKSDEGRKNRSERTKILHKNPKYREKLQKALIGRGATFEGKKHSEETKEKMRKSKNVGNSNSQYGTCWITNESENKKIKKSDLIPDGWRLGRKIK